MIWCRNKDCIHIGKYESKDAEGYFADCGVEEVVINKDGKCSDLELLGNNASEVPNYPHDPNDDEDESYDPYPTSWVEHERQVS